MLVQNSFGRRPEKKRADRARDFTGRGVKLKVRNYRLFMLVAAACALRISLGAQPYSGLSPEDAVKAMTVPDGFHVALVAAEPDLVQPVSFEFDDRGRI